MKKIFVVGSANTDMDIFGKQTIEVLQNINTDFIFVDGVAPSGPALILVW